MHAEIFVLYRNGEYYATNVDRGVLLDTVEHNPDFTEPENGKLPERQIVTYVPAVLGGVVQSGYLS